MNFDLKFNSSKVMPLFPALSILSVFYYIYFTGLSDGEGDSGFATLFLKVIAVSIFVITLTEIRTIHVKLKQIQIIYFLITFLGLLILIVKNAFIGVSDLKYINLLMASFPLAFLALRDDRINVIKFFNYCLTVVFFQVLVDFYVLFTGKSLWQNLGFIGGVGNASVFGFICNIFIAYILFTKKHTVKYKVYLIFLSIGVLFTSSLMSILVMCFSYFIYSSKKNLLVTILSLFFFLAVLYFAYESLLSDHVKFKLESLVSLFSGSELNSGSSRSVSLRVEIYETLFSNVSMHTLHVFFFGYPNYSYYTADSQFITYIASFGLLWSLMFFGLYFITLLRAVFVVKNVFLMIVLFQFFCYFITNRMLDYFPMPIFFFVFIIVTWSNKRKIDRLFYSYGDNGVSFSNDKKEATFYLRKYPKNNQTQCL